ncbi:MAG: carbonic anhydrase family protein [Candidatus Aminicenantes bacterium]|nr:carbonic anhydrase family protein [Candidatus Aminicenantes bacterium]
MGPRRNQHSADPSWGYEPHNGPEVWGALDTAFISCASGDEQSPIDLAAGQGAEVAPVEFDYRRTRFAIENTGRTIQVNPDSGSGIVLNGVRSALVQFHFHHPSEHTFDGIRLALEMHLVHRSDFGSHTVLGILFKEGQASEALAPVWKHLPPEQSESKMVPDELDLASLLPAVRTSWRYRGSLTTPPCTEGVDWVVLTEPLSMSKTQIASFGAIYPQNCRPVQPLGDRLLLRE